MADKYSLLLLTIILLYYLLYYFFEFHFNKNIYTMFLCMNKDCMRYKFAKHNVSNKSTAANQNPQEKITNISWYSTLFLLKISYNWLLSSYAVKSTQVGLKAREAKVGQIINFTVNCNHFRACSEKLCIEICYLQELICYWYRFCKSDRNI